MKRYILIQAIVTFIFIGNINAQIDTILFDADASYIQARELAFNNKYLEAREILYSILKHDEKHVDARILLARTYAWERNFDSARVNLNLVFAFDSSNYDAHHAIVDIEFWSNRLKESLMKVNFALQLYPNDEEFLLKKVRIIKGLGYHEEAIRILDKLEDKHPLSSEAYLLRKDLGAKSNYNSITLNYAIDAISGESPLQYVFMQYGRRIRFGTFYFRLNYSYRYKNEGVQYEFDLYPRFSKDTYGYFNYGYSSNALFPNHRFAGEFYSSLPFHFEGSIGFRCLNFDSEKNIKIYTGTIGYYWKDYWFSLRPYLILNDVGVSKSLNLMIRYYFGDAEDYMFARIGGGFTPDERNLQTATGVDAAAIYYLDSQTFGLGVQKTIGISYLINATFDFTNQEKSFAPDNYFKMYTLNLGLRWKF